MTLEEVKRRCILAAVRRHKGDKAVAARELGISLKTLYNWLNRMDAEGVDRFPMPPREQRGEEA